MARIRLAYIGGGSTRAPGTLASLIQQGGNFAGSEVVLVDLAEDRLELVARLARRMAAARGVDLTISATTDRRAALTDCDAVLTSFRPGGFEARALDERIPLRHSLVGQETQGAGGFFMALRTIHVMRAIVEELEQVAPRAFLFNYTNPVNLVAEAVVHHAAIPIVSLCEGPITFPRAVAGAAGLDRDRVHAVMAGLNHNCWSVEATLDGEPLGPILRAAWEARRGDETLKPYVRRLLHLAGTMEAVPADYFLYYYFRDELVDEARSKPTTRAEDILAWAPGYWSHYAEQAELDDPQLDPERSRGGIHELELALDVMDAVFNERDEVHSVNVPNRGGALPGFDHDLVVEVPGRCGGREGWIEPLAVPPLPGPVRGLVHALAEYQSLAAEAAWTGTRIDAVRALASNPLVPSLPVAERVYDEMAAAHRPYLPARLLA